MDELALVCIHGISSNSRSWRHQLSGLSERYRVIAWDGPGYGQSDDPPEPLAIADYADYLVRFLDNLGLKKVVIIGLSMGGVIAQEFYRRHTGRVRALILADTNTGGGARPEAERRVRLEARLKATETMTPAQMAQERGPKLLSPFASPELLAEVTAIIGEVHMVGFRSAAIALDAADTRAVLPTISVPTLILWGEHDSVTPRPEADTLHEAIPGALFEVIPGAGHLSNLENPAAFNRAVLEFLDSQPDC